MAVIRTSRLFLLRFANLQQNEFGPLYTCPPGHRAILRGMHWSTDDPNVITPVGFITVYLIPPGLPGLVIYRAHTRSGIGGTGETYVHYRFWETMIVLHEGDLLSFGTDPGFGNPVTIGGHGALVPY